MLKGNRAQRDIGRSRNRKRSVGNERQKNHDGNRAKPAAGTDQASGRTSFAKHAVQGTSANSNRSEQHSRRNRTRNNIRHNQQTPARTGNPFTRTRRKNRRRAKQNRSDTFRKGHPNLLLFRA